MDGSIAAEHGIGLIKRDELARYKDPVALDLMRTLKRALDPAEHPQSRQGGGDRRATCSRASDRQEQRRMKTLDILAIGEPLMEFAEVERGGERLYLPGFGGDVSNAAVAAARQGAKSGDLHGPRRRRVRRGFPRSSGTRRASTASTRHRLVEGGRTGVYFISYGEDGHVFTYARAGSAASLVRGRTNCPSTQIAAARVLHASGISQAISPKAARCGLRGDPRTRRANGTIVSYDTNLRLRLWPLDRARAVIHGAVALSDIALPGLDDAQPAHRARRARRRSAASISASAAGSSR